MKETGVTHMGMGCGQGLFTPSLAHKLICYYIGCQSLGLTDVSALWGSQLIHHGPCNRHQQDATWYKS